MGLCGKRGAYEHVYHHSYYVVGYGYERPCGNSRVDFHFFESQRDKCAENGGEHHHREQRYRYRYGGLQIRFEKEKVVGENQY